MAAGALLIPKPFFDGFGGGKRDSKQQSAPPVPMADLSGPLATRDIRT